MISLALSYFGIALAFHHEVETGENLPLMALGAALVLAGVIIISVKPHAAAQAAATPQNR